MHLIPQHLRTFGALLGFFALPFIAMAQSKTAATPTTLPANVPAATQAQIAKLMESFGKGKPAVTPAPSDAPDKVSSPKQDRANTIQLLKEFGKTKNNTAAKGASAATQPVVGPPAPAALTPYIPQYTDATLAAHTINTALPVGTIAGGADVSGGGAATYSIPIIVPPGTNGVAPTLSINYSSQGGNGHLGQGWSLGGLSAITRDGHKKIFEGEFTAVQINNNDAFSMDGEHLKVITGGSGADGTVYDTYMTSFGTIISHGNMGGGPM